MTAAPDLGVQRMETLLECCLCTETLTKPQTLSCFHSFCHHCLEKFVATQREEAVEAKTEIPEIFKCPICRTECPVKGNESVENIPSNSFINDMLASITLQQQDQCIKCQLCEAKELATCRCVSCESHLCGECLTAHNNFPALSDHVVLTLEELAKPKNRAKARSKRRCETHNKVLKFYCKTCKIFVCRYCVDINHSRPEHSWFRLAEIVEKKKDDLKSSSGIFERQLNEAVDSNLKIEHVLETLKNNAAKTKDAIMKHQQEILKAFAKKLEEETAVLLDQVEMKYNEVNKPLMKQQSDVKDYLEKAKIALCFAENIISNGTDEEILSLQNAVEEKAEKIEKERPELMDPVHNGSIEYEEKSSKTILENVKLNDLGKIVSPALKQAKAEQGALGLEQTRKELHADPLQPLLKNSIILDCNIGYAKQLVEWLEDRTFGWKLCYRASLDGWKGEDFHRKCDDVGATVTLVECGTNVFGGYTDRSWKATFGGWKCSIQSFVFSLRNGDNLRPFKCPVYDHENDKAIYCYPYYGAIFGAGRDLLISSDANTNQHSHTNLGNTYRPPDGYEPSNPQTKALLAGSYKFTLTEIEVFCC